MIKKEEWEELCCYLLSVVVGLIVGAIIFAILD